MGVGKYAVATRYNDGHVEYAVFSSHADAQGYISRGLYHDISPAVKGDRALSNVAQAHELYKDKKYDSHRMMFSIVIPGKKGWKLANIVKAGESGHIFGVDGKWLSEKRGGRGDHGRAMWLMTRILDMQDAVDDMEAQILRGGMVDGKKGRYARYHWSHDWLGYKTTL